MSAVNKTSSDKVGMIRLVLAGVLTAVGLFGWWMSYDINSADAAKNRALSDSSLTSRVQSEVSRGLAAVLSIDFGNLGQAEAMAKEVLTGEAIKEYDTLMQGLIKRADGRQLVLSASVKSAAVKTLSEDEATLLVFLDQTSEGEVDRKTGKAEKSVSAAQLSVKAVKVANVWKISGLKTL
jgi:Mce-associated membrane protein